MIVETIKTYYGFIEEILELDYVDFKIPLFQCKWVDIRRGVKNDEHDSITLVNFSGLRHHEDNLILASQAKQVFYIYMVDPADSKWFVVIEGKRRILRIDDVHDEQEYDTQFNEVIASSVVISSTLGENLDTNYIRRDHNKEFYVVKEKPD